MERLMESIRGLRSMRPTGRRAREEAPHLRRSEYSVVSCADVTSGVLNVWSELPEQVKNDPYLSSFREKFENEKGAKASTDSPQDPLRSRESFPSINAFRGENQHHPSKEHVTFIEDTEISPSPSNESRNPETPLRKAMHYLKISCLMCVWVCFTVVFMMYGEKEHNVKLSYITSDVVKDFHINETWSKPRVTLLVNLKGPFLTEEAKESGKGTEEVSAIVLWLEADSSNGSFAQKSEYWTVLVRPPNKIDFAEPSDRSRRLSVDLVDPKAAVSIRVRSNSTDTVPILVDYQVNPIDEKSGIIWSLVLLVGLYALIIFEIINRTIAATIASTSALAVLAIVGERPNLLELVSWLDLETLLLLFSMMLLVAVTAETGLFDFLAVFTFSVTKGKMWPLINLLCFFTAVLSTFLDNVTTVLLMTPVTIRLCELMGLNPVPVLMSMVIYSNVGGTATPVGDPPNVIIASNKEVVNSGIHFANFTLHMTFGILLVSLQTYAQLRFIYRDVNKLRLQLPKDVQDMKQQISVWRRAAAAIGSHSRDEEIVRDALLKKVSKLERKLSELVIERKKRAVSQEKFQNMLSSLKDKYKIRDKILLYKSAFALTFVVVAFFLHAIPELQRISLGWTALLGAILLLILADFESIENVLAKVEWTTLLFFAALFVLMEALTKLGLIQWIGGLTERLILNVNEGSRLAVAIVMLLWVSGIASAFVDNIPLTTMMIRVATSLGNNPALGLPMAPLIWSLSFGACLGGNGTLIGASANVVTAGVAEQHGYRFTFMQFFRIGFPVMLGQLVTATVYLLLCHCVFTWH